MAPGQPSRGIACHAGHITVFRSFTESGLRPFQQLFAKTAPVGGGDLFRVTLDGRPLSPADYLVIGMEKDFSDPEQKLWEFMRDVGVPSEHLPHLLETYNLPHSDELCIGLQPGLARMVRLIGSSYQSEKVLVLNDPFAPLSTEWRERLAEFIAVQTKSMQQIVVVTALSTRPQCWIGNEAISRVQIEEQFNMTVGYGVPAAELRAMVEHVREGAAADRAQQTATRAGRPAGTLTAAAEAPEIQHWLERLADALERLKTSMIGNRRWQPFHSFALAFAVACCFFVLKLWSTNSDSGGQRSVNYSERNTAAEPRSKPRKPVVEVLPEPNQARAGATPVTAGGSGFEMPPVTMVRSGVLDRYPADVRQAILNSINEKYPAAAPQQQATAEPPVKRHRKRKRTAEYPEAPVPADDRIEASGNEQAAEWESRRQAMREHFLAAIREAQTGNDE